MPAGALKYGEGLDLGQAKPIIGSEDNQVRIEKLRKVHEFHIINGKEKFSFTSIELESI